LFAGFTDFLLFLVPWFQIFAIAPCSQTPSSHALPVSQETEFHTDTELCKLRVLSVLNFMLFDGDKIIIVIFIGSTAYYRPSRPNYAFPLALLLCLISPSLDSKNSQILFHTGGLPFFLLPFILVNVTFVHGSVSLA
jgi:hypothetical protein